MEIMTNEVLSANTNLHLECLHFFRTFFIMSDDIALYHWVSSHMYFIEIIVNQLSCTKPSEANLIQLIMLNKILSQGEITHQTKFKDFMLDRDDLLVSFEKIQHHKDDHVYNLHDLIINKYFDQNDIDQVE